MTPKKIESVRKTMQAQLDAQKAAIELWRAGDPTRERTIPQPWELTQFLMGRLKNRQLMLKVALGIIRDAYPEDPSVAERVARLERSL